MKKITLLLLLILSIKSFSQKNIKIELSKSYELGNIILALTKYGKTDPNAVQKVPPYYNEILTYFEPVKNHPLLDSVNYSGQDWEKFLGFRTDMYAFSFDQNGKLKRDYPFNSFGPEEVDKNLELINDFVKKSNYIKFYNEHKNLYSELVSNYREYYFIDKSFSFLDKFAPNQKTKRNGDYVIAISPLVGSQNCHRDIDSLTTVDFPNISKDLILGKMNENVSGRITDNHSIFTEMDHGYVNPISDKYAELIAQNFDIKKWDNESGYPGINSFNEYMTPMQKSKVIDIVLIQFENGSQGHNQKNLRINDPIWSEDGKSVKFKIISEFEEYAVGFYVWDSSNGLYSTNNILLNSQSYILLKK